MKKIGLLGFGNVGSSFYDLLTEHPILSKEYKVEVILVQSRTKKRRQNVQKLLVYSTSDFLQCQIDILIDASNGEEPSSEIIRRCLQKGIDVISSNKVAVKNHFYEFNELAISRQIAFLFEASTVSGIPIVHALQELVLEDEIFSISGILNGSTNYCLSRVFLDNKTLEEAVEEAKLLGYLESDPTQDLDGFDSLRKIIILSNMAYGVDILEESCHRSSLTSISEQMILYLKERGYVLKYIATSSYSNNEVEVSVEAVALKENHFIAQINQETNIIMINSKNRGMLSWRGKGAGGIPTASAIISDLFQIRNKTYLMIRTEQIHKVRSIETQSLSEYFVETKKGEFIHYESISLNDLLTQNKEAICFCKVKR